MTNPNNCATCDYSRYEHEGGHCYMFRNAPEVVCMQHTGRKQLVPNISAALAVALLNGTAGVALVDTKTE